MTAPLCPVLSPPSAGGGTATPATFPAGAEPEARAPGSGARRAFSIPFAAPTRADLRRREAANGPAAADPSRCGATLSEHEAGASSPPALCGGAASPLPGRAAGPSGHRLAPLYRPPARLDLPATLRWALPPAEVAALAAALLFGTAATIWFTALTGGV